MDYWHLNFGVFLLGASGSTIIKEHKISVSIDGFWRFCYDPTVKGPLLPVMFSVESNTSGAYLQAHLGSLSIGKVSRRQNLTLDTSLPPTLTLKSELVLNLPYSLPAWKHCLYTALTPHLQDILTHCVRHLTLLKQCLA